MIHPQLTVQRIPTLSQGWMMTCRTAAAGAFLEMPGVFTDRLSAEQLHVMQSMYAAAAKTAADRVAREAELEARAIAALSN